MTTAAVRQALSAPDAARARVSIRKYQDVAIPEADLRNLLQLASLAPSAFNVQPWRYVVVTDPELKQKVQEVAYNQPQVGNAPAVIVMYTDMADVLATVDEIVHPGLPEERRESTKAMVRGAWEGKSDEERESWGLSQGNIAFGYLLLLAQSLGYGTSPMLGFDQEKMKELLGLPAHVRFPGIVSIGLPAEDGFPQHRHSVDRVAQFR